METIHSLSSVTPLPAFDLWGVPGTQLTVEKDTEIECRPLSAVDVNAPITFCYKSAINEYVVLDSVYLSVLFSISVEKQDNSDLVLDDGNDIHIANYSLHALFKQSDIEINGQSVSNSANCYSYRAYLEALIGYSKDAKNACLITALWEESSVRRSHRIKPKQQSLNFKTGLKVSMFGKLHSDLGFQGRVLIGGAELKIQLLPNQPVFFSAISGRF